MSTVELLLDIARLSRRRSSMPMRLTPPQGQLKAHGAQFESSASKKNVPFPGAHSHVQLSPFAKVVQAVDESPQCRPQVDSKYDIRKETVVKLLTEMTVARAGFKSSQPWQYIGTVVPEDFCNVVQELFGDDCYEALKNLCIRFEYVIFKGSAHIFLRSATMEHWKFAFELNDVLFCQLEHMKLQSPDCAWLQNIQLHSNALKHPSGRVFTPLSQTTPDLEKDSMINPDFFFTFGNNLKPTVIIEVYDNRAAWYDSAALARTLFQQSNGYIRAFVAFAIDFFCRKGWYTIYYASDTDPFAFGDVHMRNFCDNQAVATPGACTLDLLKCVPLSEQHRISPSSNAPAPTIELSHGWLTHVMLYSTKDYPMDAEQTTNEEDDRFDIDVMERLYDIAYSYDLFPHARWRYESGYLAESLGDLVVMNGYTTSQFPEAKFWEWPDDWPQDPDFVPSIDGVVDDAFIQSCTLPKVDGEYVGLRRSKRLEHQATSIMYLKGAIRQMRLNLAAAKRKERSPSPEGDRPKKAARAEHVADVGMTLPFRTAVHSTRAHGGSVDSRRQLSQSSKLAGFPERKARVEEQVATPGLPSRFLGTKPSSGGKKMVRFDDHGEDASDTHMKLQAIEEQEVEEDADMADSAA